MKHLELLWLRQRRYQTVDSLHVSTMRTIKKHRRQIILRLVQRLVLERERGQISEPLVTISGASQLQFARALSRTICSIFTWRIMGTTMRLYNINSNLIQVIENLSSTTRPLMQSTLMVAQKTGSEPQWESDNDVYSHRLFSTSFWRELWLTH